MPDYLQLSSIYNDFNLCQKLLPLVMNFTLITTKHVNTFYALPCLKASAHNLSNSAQARMHAASVRLPLSTIYCVSTYAFILLMIGAPQNHRITLQCFIQKCKFNYRAKTGIYPFHICEPRFLVTYENWWL